MTREHLRKNPHEGLLCHPSQCMQAAQCKFATIINTSVVV
jgi:hypothetical protein